MTARAEAESCLTSMALIHWFEIVSSLSNALAFEDGAAMAVAGRMSRQSSIASK